MVIGDTLCHPQGTQVIGSRTGDFEEPQLVLVGHRQALSSVAIAVLLGQGSHQRHCLAGGATPLQCQCLQVLNVEQPLRVHQFPAAHNGSLSYRQLFLIHTRIAGVQEGIRVRHLWHRTFQHHSQPVVLALGVTHIPVNIDLGRIGPVLSGHHLHPRARRTIARSRSDDRPVHGRLLPHRNTGTTLFGVGQFDHPLLRCGTYETADQH